MSLIDGFFNFKPREEAGSKTARKYSFQNDWSLYYLLRNHEKMDDYVYLFDFHEDLVLVDSETNPQKIDFYQIKSKDSGNWTLNSLIKTEKNKLSILGKLYMNKINFPLNTKSINFISNAKFSIGDLVSDDLSTSKTEINAKEFNQTIINICKNALNKELTPNLCDDIDEYLNLKVTKLSNMDSSTHCQGELSNLVNTLNPNNRTNIKLAYTQLFGEIKKKASTTTTDKKIKDFKDLIELKGFSKKQFLELLNNAGLYKSVEEEWIEIEPHLKNCNIGFLELSKYKKGWKEVSMKIITEIDKIPLNNHFKDVGEILDEGEINGEINDKMSLLDIINYCVGKLKPHIFPEYFTKSLIIKRIYEKHR